MQSILISDLMQTSGVQFGTSGARGLVARMSDAVCYAYTAAFLQHLRASGQLGTAPTVAVAGDYRFSTPRILAAVTHAVIDAGLRPDYCGRIPAPALAYYGMQQGVPSIMVTGSHIPDDRNGIKFNSAKGEILKDDEAGIRTQRVALPEALRNDAYPPAQAPRLPDINEQAYRRYVARYVDFFPERFLAGTRIGLYQHSSVARDIFYDILAALGAHVDKLAPSEQFVSVDTEAIRPEDVALARAWAQHGAYNALISADGDADRPLVADEYGEWLRGDVAGILCARYLRAAVVATPVSSNSAVDKCGWFTRVMRTRIGSPYVVAAMQTALAAKQQPVVGYEANGGFLTGSDITLNGRTLTALPTRDAMLVPLALLALAQQQSKTIRELLATLPPRYTASGRVEHFPTALSQTRIATLAGGDAARDLRAIDTQLATLFGPARSVDHTDGLRITFANEEVVHLRPSGNAPEFRCYTEADSAARAQAMLDQCIAQMEQWKTL